MPDRSKKALADFVAEAQEIIDAFGRDVMRLDAAGAEPEPDLLNAVFRAAHSLKGLSSMFAVERMARLAHALEDLLDDVRMGRRGLDRAATDLLLEAPEVFSRIVAEEASGQAPRTADAVARLTDRLRGGAARIGSSRSPSPHPLSPDPGGEGPSTRSSRSPSPQPLSPGPGGDGSFAARADPLDALAISAEVRAVLTEYEEHRLRAAAGRGLGIFRVKASFGLATFDRDLAALAGRLKSLGEVVSTLPSSDARDPQAIAFELLFASTEPEEAIRAEAGAGAAVEAVPRRDAPGGAASAGAAAPGAPPRANLSPPPEPQGDEGASLRSASQAVRVDIGKLDRLMTVVGELVLVKSSLLAIAERLKAEAGDPALAAELQRANRTLERRLDELQAGILEVRMVPLEQVFDKLARMVRRTAREVGKEVELEVTGGDVELDKLIVEELSDPLMHLIRNAIDHAVEPPAERARLGKPRAGRVRLAAAQRGNHVEILVEDDGAGIDEDRIREVAVQRGLASASAVREMPRREVMNLIFVPGFSTARQVTPLSGRGVGMDVVKTNIANLSGIIDLHTERGRGTRFEITLPVTLAIVRALVVAAAGRTYALPLNSVLEILEVGEREVRTLSTREVISVRGATLPLVRLARFFALPGAPSPERLFVVVVGLAQERLGVAVDELVGQQDIVVKPLGAQLRSVRGVAGATDLGSRRTVLVLDVGAIVEEVLSGEGPREASG